jgi:ABC-type amino acid transport substrate-binding protein/mono/diheme cytochrome c family protein
MVVGLALGGLALAGLSGGNAVAAISQNQTLRVCADPDNLPFSSDNSSRKGLYIELAEQMAADMNRRVEVYWWPSYIGGRTVRLTLLSENCDAYFGLPRTKGFMGPKVIFTKPLLEIGYALIVPKTMSLGGLADLMGKRVGVQFNTPAQDALAATAGIEAVTFIKAEEALEALKGGRVDAAFIWGPIAGYYNKQVLNGSFRVIPTAGPRLVWQAAIGVRGDEAALRDALDRALERQAATIERLKAEYGFPRGTPLAVDWLAPVKGTESRVASTEVSMVRVAATQAGSGDKTPASKPASKPKANESKQGGEQKLVGAVPPANVKARAGGTAADIKEGKKLFNAVLGCAHCHGPDAKASELPVDLRRLRLRYGDKVDQVYRETVLKGREDDGMPAWEAFISPEEMAKIKVFIDSVQVSE